MARKDPWHRFDTERAQRVLDRERDMTTVGGVVIRAVCHSDAEALRAFCRHGAAVLRSGDAIDDDTREALAAMLADIAAGASPNEAMGRVRPGDKGRRGNPAKERRDLDIALAAAHLVAGGLNTEDAFHHVADRTPVSDRGAGAVSASTVRAAYLKFFPASR